LSTSANIRQNMILIISSYSISKLEYFFLDTVYYYYYFFGLAHPGVFTFLGPGVHGPGLCAM